MHKQSPTPQCDLITEVELAGQLVGGLAFVARQNFLAPGESRRDALLWATDIAQYYFDGAYQPDDIARFRGQLKAALQDLADRL